MIFYKVQQHFASCHVLGSQILLILEFWIDSQYSFSWNSSGTECLHRVIYLGLQTLLWNVWLLWKELAEKGFSKIPTFFCWLFPKGFKFHVRYWQAVCHSSLQPEMYQSPKLFSSPLREPIHTLKNVHMWASLWNWNLPENTPSWQRLVI